MYKRLARRGMQGYMFLPWRKVSIGGERNKKEAEKDDMIIYQIPATLNVEFHRNQHGLSDLVTQEDDDKEQRAEDEIDESMTDRTE